LVIQGLFTFRQSIAGLKGTDFYLGQIKFLRVERPYTIVFTCLHHHHMFQHVGTNGCLDASMAHGRNPFIMLNNMKYIEARRFHPVLFCFICKLNFKNEHLLNDSDECTFEVFCPYPPYKKKTVLSQVRICLSPSHEKWPSLHKRCAMCWNEWKIIFQIFPIFSFWVIVVRDVTIRLQKIFVHKWPNL